MITPQTEKINTDCSARSHANPAKYSTLSAINASVCGTE